MTPFSMTQLPGSEPAGTESIWAVYALSYQILFNSSELETKYPW